MKKTDEDKKEVARLRSAKWYQDNKVLANARAKSWSENNKQARVEIHRKSKAKRLYDCTLEEFDERMKSSDCCECCGTTYDLCYDHDHDTMEFRGVLCGNCNRAIGILGDNIQGLENALKYLKRTKK